MTLHLKKYFTPQRLKMQTLLFHMIGIPGSSSYE